MPTLIKSESEGVESRGSLNLTEAVLGLNNLCKQ